MRITHEDRTGARSNQWVGATERSGDEDPPARRGVFAVGGVHSPANRRECPVVAMVQIRRRVHTGNTVQSGTLPLRQPLRESTMATRVKKTSLTAHLARAAAMNAHPSQDTARAAAEGQRCTSSLIHGQQCSRLAPKGQDLCAGHAAMSATGPRPTSRRR